VIVCLSGLLGSSGEAIPKGIGERFGKVFHMFPATALCLQASLAQGWGEWVKWAENE
jgi:hypothetical protein